VQRLPAPALPDWLGEMVPFQRYRVEVGDGLAMHVMETGVGRPVVMLHGNPTWGFLYRRVAAELASEPYRLIMPDLMGLGFSDRAGRPEDYTLANYSGWTSSLLDRLSLEEAVFVGQDWGGPIGMHAASRNAGMMTGAVVLNTMLTPPKPGFRPTTFHRLFSTRLGDVASRYLGLPQRALRFAQGDRSSITGLVSRGYSYPLSRQRGNEAVGALVRMVPDSTDHPSVALLGEVADFVGAFTGPAAIVWGRADPVLGRVLGRAQRLLPQATTVETDAGHFLQEEVPAQIADAVRKAAD